jgi:hypothetical protein
MENLQTLSTLAESLPETVRGNALSLLEEINTPIEGIGDEPKAWKPSFLRLVQGTTDRGSLPKGTAIGDFVLGEKKLEQPLKFIPIRIWDSRQFWDPDQTNNKMLCWSPDAKFGQIGRECRGCPHAEWKEGEGSECTKTKSVMAISADLSTIFVINFSKSNFKIGLELEKLMERAAVAPYFRTYGLTSATSSTAKNVENYKIEALDEKLRRTPEDIIPFLRELFKRVSEDRKASVEAFYKASYDRRDRLALENGGKAPMAIENSGASETTTTIAVVEEASKSTTSSMAAKYTV